MVGDSVLAENIFHGLRRVFFCVVAAEVTERMLHAIGYVGEAFLYVRWDVFSVFDKVCQNEFAYCAYHGMWLFPCAEVGLGGPHVSELTYSPTA